MYRLLVVNGDPDAGPALSTLFEDNGFRVLLADTFELGIRRAETYRPGRPGSRGRAGGALVLVSPVRAFVWGTRLLSSVLEPRATEAARP
jgi:hypothetical protein